MRRLFIVSVAMLWSAVAAFAAEPIGSYKVEGANPGGKGQYTGTVSVTKTGETYQVIWVVAGTRYIGTGIGNKDFLAVSYKSGSQTGLALYGPSGDGWTGVWTYAGGKELGPETWKRN